MTTEQKILMTARTLFSKKLYVEVSIVDIVFKAGVARRSFYNHFETKDECFVKTALPVLKELPDFLLSIKYIDNPTLTHVIEKAIEFFDKNTMLLRNCTALMYATENLMLRDLLYTAHKDMYVSAKKHFTEYIVKSSPEIEEKELSIKTDFMINSIMASSNALMLNTVMPNSESLSKIFNFDPQMAEWIIKAN